MNKILLVGVGYMGTEYAKVLKSLKKNFVAVGKGPKNAIEFEKEIGIKPYLGGIEKWLSLNNKIPKTAIVATTEDTLGKITILLIKSGVKNILTEKPGAFTPSELKKVDSIAKKYKANVYIGYNRRFYSSLKKAQKLIQKDGGVTSIFFDFTELGFRLKDQPIPLKIKREWFFHNSTHVIDMAFYLAGNPKILNTHTSGSLKWHPKGSVFCGSGITTHNVLFSYIANWDAPGRWSVEVATKKNKFVFKPLEKLQTQKLGRFELENVDIPDKYDIKYKPGLYLEVKSFLTNKNNLCTLHEQIENIKIYSKILG